MTPPIKLAGFLVLVALIFAGAHAAGTRLHLVREPLADDVVLDDPVPFEGRQNVPLTLGFRHAGQVTIDASVTAPGTP